MKFLARIAPATVLVLVLSGCDMFSGPTGPILPGTRISVLQLERALSPDQGTSKTQILLPAPTITTEWPQAGGYANHAMHHVAVGNSLAQTWSSNFGAGATDESPLLGPPVIASGRLFVMDTESVVSALNAETGAQIWRRNLTPKDEDDEHIGGGVAYDDARIYIATGFAEVIALNANDGSEIWRQRVSGPMHIPPTVHDGRIFVVTLDNTLNVLASVDGTLLWTNQGKTEDANLLGGASPAVDEGIVVVPYSSGELLGLAVDSGEVIWSDSLAPIQRTNVISTLSHIRGRPAIDRGRVFAVSYGGVMSSVNLRTGRRIWEKDIGSLDGPWVVGNFLYTITRNSELICITRNSGRILWVQPLPRFEDEEDKQDPIIWSGPVLASDRLIIAGTDGRALTFSPYTGQMLGQLFLPAAVTMAPVIANQIVYFVTDDAEVVAFR
jgi:outer membrane protein assembly factor BamB